MAGSENSHSAFEIAGKYALKINIKALPHCLNGGRDSDTKSESSRVSSVKVFSAPQ